VSGVTRATRARMSLMVIPRPVMAFVPDSVVIGTMLAG
jgi:hypothetical protein